MLSCFWSERLYPRTGCGLHSFAIGFNFSKCFDYHGLEAFSLDCWPSFRLTTGQEFSKLGDGSIVAYCLA